MFYFSRVLVAANPRVDVLGFARTTHLVRLQTAGDCRQSGVVLHLRWVTSSVLQERPLWALMTKPLVRTKK